jgi:hypothetical protein
LIVRHAQWRVDFLDSASYQKNICKIMQKDFDAVKAWNLNDPKMVDDDVCIHVAKKKKRICLFERPLSTRYQQIIPDLQTST